MSHATSDLEYFMCDMCHVYVHRDIYCNHRRECKGPDSKELKKKEVKALSDEIGKAQRLATAAACQSSDGPAATRSCAVSLGVVEKATEMRVRNRVADEYQAKKDAEITARMGNTADLLALLESS